MSKKQNIFCTAAALSLGLFMFGAYAQAANSPSVQSTSAQIAIHQDLAMPSADLPRVTQVGQTIDSLLKHIRNRERDQAFALLSNEAQARFGGDARTFMNSLRLYHHALYDHTAYRLIDQGARPASTGEPLASMVVKVQLIDQSGRENLILVRVSPDANGIWQIDGVTSVGNAKARDA